jgi:sugar/nucleoside kinase (ribokinase family)
VASEEVRAEPARYRRLVGVGGIGAGMVFALDGGHDLGRNESRAGRLLDVRDYCKLHIVAHYPSVLLGARPEGTPFHVMPLGKVGSDDIGRRLRHEMAQAGMDVRFVETVAGRPTLLSVCLVYPDGSGGNVTTVDSAAALLTPADLDRATDFLDRDTMALAVPEVPLGVRQHLLRLAGRRGALRVAAVTSGEMGEARERSFFTDVDLLALNEDEAGTLGGRAFARDDPRPLLDACVAALASMQPEIRLVVTAGADGAYGFEQGRWVKVPALEVPVASTAGAGDALLGGIMAGLAAGAPFVPDPTVARSSEDGASEDGSPKGGSSKEGGGSLRDRRLTSALELGTLLAAYAVTSPHTIHPDARPEALRSFAHEHGITLAPRLGGLRQGDAA